MEFTDVTGDIDAYYISLDRAYTPQCKRKSSRTSEDDAKIELWKSLAASLKSQDNIKAKSESFERGTLFGKVGADSLLQYDPKKWCYLKKKVMDVCYDYEQLKSNSHPIYQTNLSKRIISNQLILWTWLVMYQRINLLTCDASESIFSHENFDNPK